MSSQPFTLYSHKQGPNGWKVAILFEELGLPYKSEWKEFGDGDNGVKGATFLKIVSFICSDLLFTYLFRILMEEFQLFMILTMVLTYGSQVCS